MSSEISTAVMQTHEKTTLDQTPKDKREDPPQAQEPVLIKEIKTFILEDTVQFGYHNISSPQIKITQNGIAAEKRDPESQYAHGVAYGARPLRGTAEFEVKIASYGTGWSGTLKLGVMRALRDMPLIGGPCIPRYSPEGVDHLVWSSDKIHNRLNTPAVESTYTGAMNLDDLREGDRVGLRLSTDGVLVFFVNGKSQGVAAENIYDKEFDVYAVVDHYANCKSTIITRAVMRVDFNLEELCLEKVSRWVKSGEKVDRLPLPARLKDKVKQYIK